MQCRPTRGGLRPKRYSLQAIRALRDRATQRPLLAIPWDLLMLINHLLPLPSVVALSAVNKQLHEKFAILGEAFWKAKVQCHFPQTSLAPGASWAHSFAVSYKDRATALAPIRRLKPPAWRYALNDIVTCIYEGEVSTLKTYALNAEIIGEKIVAAKKHTTWHGRNLRAIALRSKNKAVLDYFYAIESSHYRTQQREALIPLATLYQQPMATILQFLNEGGNFHAMWEGRTMLHYAAASGRVEVMEYGLSVGLDVEARVPLLFHTPVELACESGHQALTLWLLEHMINEKKMNTILGAGIQGSLLEYLAMTGHLQGLQALLKHTSEDFVRVREATRLPSMYTALGFAVKQGNLDVIRLLIEKGSDVRRLIRLRAIRPRRGFSITLLHVAVLSNHVDVARMLVTHGISVNALDSTNHPALFYACREGHEEMVQVLLSLGAIIEEHTVYTSLHIAALYGHFAVLKLLLTHFPAAVISAFQGCRN